MASRNLFLAVSLCALGVNACSGAASGETPEQEAAIGVAGYYAEVSAKEAAEMISQSPDLVVLDVRTPEEFAQGHIDGAINVNLRGDDFLEQLAQLDHAATYVLHCKSGTRSAEALEVMKAQEFSSIVHMSEGFDGWTAAGLDIAQ